MSDKYTIEYLPEGYYRCPTCKTLVESGKYHQCITSEQGVTFSYPSDRQLLTQILNELQEIKKLLENR